MTEKILKAPQLGEGLTTVKIVAIYKQTGDQIKRDEVIYAVETDKATVDIESPFEGQLAEWSVKVDEIIDVGAPVARIVDQAIIKTTSPELNIVVDKSTEFLIRDSSHGQLPIHTASGVFIPPRTRAYCSEKGLRPCEILEIPATGKSLTPDMVDTYLSNRKSHDLSCDPVSERSNQQSDDSKAQAFAQGTYNTTDINNQMSIKPISSQQRWLNTHFKRSSREVIQATLTSFLDLKSLQVFNKKILNHLGGHSSTKYISEFQLFAYLVSRVLEDFPKLRSVLVDEKQYREYSHVNLGIAVQTEQGELVTAVVDNADTLDPNSFFVELNLQVEKAMQGKDQANEDMPVVLSYMGGGNVLFGAPLLVSPAVATLFFSIPDAERKRQDGRAYLSLTFDHRLINGMDASGFLNALDEGLNQSINEFDIHSNISAFSQDTVSDKVCQLIAKHLRLRLNELPVDKKLIDLGVDSISMMRLKFALEQGFDCDISLTELVSDVDLNGLVSAIMKAVNDEQPSNVGNVSSAQVQVKKSTMSVEDYLSCENDLSAFSESDLDDIYVNVKNKFSKEG